jgi:5'-3' exonuclease
MSDFNYQAYLKNNPLLQEEVKEEKLLTESQEIDETVEDSVSEDARTDAEQEGYKDGFDDAKDDVKAALSKMKVSELKAKIKEDIISLLQEDEEDEVEDDVEMDIDVEEPTADVKPEVGLSQDEQEIQDSLKLAYDNAVAIGDEKLADQIGNSITFFTRTHVVER